MTNPHQADCQRCAALCCVHLDYRESGDFGHDKPAGTPCHHLDDAHQCSIHGRLRASGYRGCVAFDCHGAGQRATTHADPGAALLALLPLAHLAWHTHEARQWALPEDLQGQVDALHSAVVAGLEQAPGSVEVWALRRRAGDLLTRVSVRLRAPAGPNLSGRSLIEADLQGRNLQRADLSRALLLGADLRDADLRGADLRGADLRAADLRGADLRGALFLTPGQLAQARTDDRTRALSEAM